MRELNTLEEGKKADLQAAALLLAETFFSGLATSAAGRLRRSTLQRLLFTTFHSDMPGLRSYCLAETDGALERLVGFLDADEGAGWNFLQGLLNGTSALQLMQHSFLAAARTAPPPRIL
jgi:hypothetical protein